MATAIAGTGQVIQYTLRIAQTSLALAGLGFLLSYDFDSSYINSTFASHLYIHFLLFIFGFSIVYPVLHILILLEKLKHDILGKRKDQVLIGIELVWCLLWCFTAISLLVKVLKVGCVLLNGYIGLCTLMFPLDVLGWVMVVMTLVTTFLSFRFPYAPGENYDQ